MTKRKRAFTTASEAVSAAIASEKAKRGNDLKPIEVVKTALCAYQAHVNGDAAARAKAASRGARKVESQDREGFRRGRQDAMDRMLFNVNYWLDAYEDRIVAACANPEDARALLEDISAWNRHPMRLNTLSADGARAMFERFCPPLCENNRRGQKVKGAVQPFPRSISWTTIPQNGSTS